MSSPRVLLVSLRDSHDAMAAHELECFRTQARLDHLDIHSMMDGHPDLSGYDAVLFGGSGAYSVLDPHAWIQDAVRVLIEVVDKRIPSWASCFGFQGLSMALGGTVIHDNDRAEMGSVQLTPTPDAAADPVFSALPARFWAQEGHHDHVIDLPPGVTLMVTGAAIPNQAFRVDGAPFWASQFHPELTRETTLDRFHYYADHYLKPEEREPMLAQIGRGQDSPEVAELLYRATRMGRTPVV
jgi:GMP synthase (glutamine-hydrolysing)